MFRDYEADPEPEYECSSCNNLDKRFDAAAHWLESILDRMYSAKPDINAIENDMDELCHLFNVKMRRGDIQIQAKDYEDELQKFLGIPKFIQLNEKE